MGERVLLRAAAGATALLLSGCLGLRSSIRTSPSALAGARTFAFFDAEHGATGSLDDAAQHTIEDAMRIGLAAHGLRASAEPDLLVFYTAINRPLEGFAAIGYRFGTGFGVGATVSPMLEGIDLEVTILDLRSNRVAWYTRTLGHVPRGRQLRRLRAELLSTLRAFPSLAAGTLPAKPSP